MIKNCVICGRFFAARSPMKTCSKACSCEKERERSRKYREANREKVREHSRKYREANREKARERSRKYREANREKVRERKRKYKRTRDGATEEECAAMESMYRLRKAIEQKTKG